MGGLGRPLLSADKQPPVKGGAADPTEVPGSLSLSLTAPPWTGVASTRAKEGWVCPGDGPRVKMSPWGTRRGVVVSKAQG